MRLVIRVLLFFIILLTVSSYSLLIAYAHDVKEENQQALNKQTQQLLARKETLEARYEDLTAYKSQIQQQLLTRSTQQRQTLVQNEQQQVQAAAELLRQQELARQQALAEQQAAQASTQTVQQVPVTTTRTVRRIVPRTRAS